MVSRLALTGYDSMLPDRRKLERRFRRLTGATVLAVAVLLVLAVVGGVIAVVVVSTDGSTPSSSGSESKTGEATAWARRASRICEQAAGRLSQMHLPQTRADLAIVGSKWAQTELAAVKDLRGLPPSSRTKLRVRRFLLSYENAYRSLRAASRAMAAGETRSGARGLARFNRLLAEANKAAGALGAGACQARVSD